MRTASKGTPKKAVAFRPVPEEAATSVNTPPAGTPTKGWRQGVALNMTPKTPTTPLGREALKEIVSSPSPSVATLVQKHKSMESELAERARLEKEREEKRADMLREASLLRAIRRRRAEAARDALLAAERELASAQDEVASAEERYQAAKQRAQDGQGSEEEAAAEEERQQRAVEARDRLASQVQQAKQEVTSADEEHMNAVLIEKECISTPHASPDKLNNSVDALGLLSPVAPKAGAAADLSRSRLLEDELCVGGTECMAAARSLLSEGDFDGARGQLRSAREHFLDAGDDKLMEKLPEIQQIEFEIEREERADAKRRREEASGKGEAALQSVQRELEGGSLTEAWKWLGTAEAAFASEGVTGKAQILQAWEARIREAEEKRAADEEEQRKRQRERQREALERDMERRRHKERGDENLEMAMDALRKDDFSRARLLVVEAGSWYDRAGVDMRAGITAILQRARQGEALALEKRERENMQKEEEERRREEEEAERKRADEEQEQARMNAQLGENAMRDCKVAATSRGDFASARRLLGLAEAAFSRAGLEEERRAVLDEAMEMIRRGEEERASAAALEEKCKVLAQRGDSAVDACRALVGEFDFARARALLEKAGSLYAEAGVDRQGLVSSIAASIDEAEERKRRKEEAEARRKEEAAQREREKEERLRRERREAEQERLFEGERRKHCMMGQEKLLEAVEAFTRCFDFERAKACLEEAEAEYRAGGREDEVRDEMEGMRRSIEEAEALVKLQERQQREVEEAKRAATEEGESLIKEGEGMLDREKPNVKAAREVFAKASKRFEEAGVDRRSQMQAIAERLDRIEGEEAEKKAQREALDMGDNSVRMTLAVIRGGGAVSEARAILEQAVALFEQANALSDRRDQIEKVRGVLAEAQLREETIEEERLGIVAMHKAKECWDGGMLQEALQQGEVAREKLGAIKDGRLEHVEGMVAKIRRELEAKEEEARKAREGDKAIEAAVRALELQGDVESAKRELENAVQRYGAASAEISDLKKPLVDEVRRRVGLMEDAIREREKKEREEQERRKQVADAALKRAKAVAQEAVLLAEKCDFEGAKQAVERANQEVRAAGAEPVIAGEVLMLESWIDQMEKKEMSRRQDVARLESERKAEEERLAREREKEERVQREEEERKRREEEERVAREKAEIENRRRREERRIAAEKAEAERLEMEREEEERKAREKLEREEKRKQEIQRIAAERQQRKKAEEEQRRLQELQEAAAQRQREKEEEERRVREEQEEEQRALMRAKEMEEARRRMEKQAEVERAMIREKLREAEAATRKKACELHLENATHSLGEGEYASARESLTEAQRLAAKLGDAELQSALADLQSDVDDKEMQQASAPPKLSLPSRVMRESMPAAQITMQHSSLVNPRSPRPRGVGDSPQDSPRGRAYSPLASAIAARQSLPADASGAASAMGGGAADRPSAGAARPRSSAMGSSLGGLGGAGGTFSALGGRGGGLKTGKQPVERPDVAAEAAKRSSDQFYAYPWSSGQPEDDGFDATELLSGGLTVGADTRLPSLAGPKPSRFLPTRDPRGALSEQDIKSLSAFGERAKRFSYNASGKGGLFHLIQVGDEEALSACREFRFHQDDAAFVERLKGLSAPQFSRVL